MSLKVFIGFDPRQPVAFQVCAQSVWEHASKPVEIVRLDLRTLPITRRGLTEFTYSRFLVPYLSNFEGRSLFLDSDILVMDDIFKLESPDLDLEDFDSEVAFVPHMGSRGFERASVMLFANRLCGHMTPKYVQSEKCFDYSWTKNPTPLRKEWNHLVGYDAPNPDAKIVHFTMGIPIWKETIKSEFAQEWIDTYKRMNSSVSFEELMGKSVHVPHLDKLKVTA